MHALVPRLCGVDVAFERIADVQDCAGKREPREAC